MRVFRLKTICTLLLLTATFSVARGAEPSESLLRLVGDDVGLCVEISELNTAMPAILRSEFVSRLKSLQLYRDWLECDDYRKLARSREGIEKFAGKRFDQMFHELFGKSAVVAIYPSPSGELKGVVITRAADKATLDWFLQTWNRQAAVKTEALEHGGQTYVRRTRQGGKTPLPQLLYYVRFDDTFALSDQESIIHRIIELRAAAHGSAERSATATDGVARSLYDSEKYRATQRDLSPDSLARVYFNPRACSSSANLFAEDGTNDPLRKLLAAGWQRCDAIGAGVRFDDGVIVEANLDFDSNGLPPEWKATLEAAKGRPEFLSRVPRGATIAAIGRVDASSIAKLLASSLDKLEGSKWSGVRQIARGLLLGRDPLDDVLPGFGKNWTCYFVPRPATSSNEFPADALFAVELPAEDSNAPRGGPPSMREALDNALNTGLNYLAALHNEKSTAPAAVVRTKETGSTRMRWIEKFGDFEPACAIMSDALVFATSPGTIDGFDSTSTGEKLTSSPLYQKLSAKYFSNESQLLLVNVAAVRHFVRQHAELVSAESAKDGATTGSGDAETAKRKLKHDSQIADVLQLFDAAFVSGRLDEDRVHLVVGAVLLPGVDVTESASRAKER